MSEMDVYVGVLNYNGPCIDSHEDPDEYLFCTEGCVNIFEWGSQQFDINLAGLNIGSIYYILISGCNDFCDISFDVLTPSCGGGPLGPWPGDIEGPLVSCTGSSGVYYIERPVGASNLHWYLDGNLILEGNIDSVTIDWTTAGTYELCVDASNYCHEENEEPGLLCTTIVIQDLVPIDPDPVTICHDETYLYAGMAYPPGVHAVPFFNPLGCDSTVQLTVEPVFPTEENLGALYLCEGTSLTVHGQTFSSAQPGDHTILTQQALAPYCDSTILFSIGVLHVEAYVSPPDELGCQNPVVTLDGSGSVATGPPGTTVLYQWHAFGGGVLGDPSDGPVMNVTSPGDYCLAIDVIAPDGSITCSDTACVIVVPSGELPLNPLLSGPVIGCPGDTLSYALMSQGATAPTGYMWVLPPGLNTIHPTDSTLVWIPAMGDTISLCGSITNDCGTSGQTCVQVVNGKADTVQLSAQTCDSAKAGIFTDTLSNHAGCDSLVIRTITLTPELRDTLFNQTCDPAQAGVFSDTLSSQQGCDSIVVHVVSLTPELRDTLLSQTCDPVQAGVFIDTLSSQQGCDSIIVHLVTLLATDQTDLSLQTCDPVLVGTDTLSLQNQYGCDSLVVTTTSLLPSHNINQTFYTCDPAQAGLDTLFLTNQYGCDSTLYIERIYSGNYQETNQTLICGVGVNYADTLLVSSGPCDSLFITKNTYAPLDTTWLSGTTCDPTQAGITIAVQPSFLGCDSTIVITTSLLPTDSTLVSGVTCDPAGAIYSVSILSNQYGCDSVVTTDIKYVGIDTLYVAKTTCEPSQVGTVVSILPGVDCDTVLVTETTYVPFTQSEETIILCGQTGVLSDTTYLQNSAGCDSLAIRYYEYVSLTSQFQIQGETCAGDQDGHIEIMNISGGQAPFELQLNAGGWQSATVFNDLSPGQYTIYIRDATGCLDTLTGLVITPGATVAIDAGPDRIAAPGEVIDLSAQTTQSLAQVQWTATDPLSCPTCLQTTLGPLTTNQTVVVTGWTLDGCTDSDALEVIIKTRGNIFIPNSFTPNGDGINDVFSIYGNDQVSRIRNLAIFDRWGNALYARTDLPINDPSAGWDGTFRDEVMDPGVYICVVEVELIDGAVRLYKGDVTLTR
ncbi:MAG: gliding motility-associated C-terminal domain-containing protein [Saprospiraceae bacterium]|nr:gliding motility-associated C-terminal domain-containing protein [Saprospiraceae bacterium]